jgi:hypothetical protein
MLNRYISCMAGRAADLCNRVTHLTYLTCQRIGYEAICNAFGLLLAAVTLAGCVSKDKADAKARAAFVAGQQQASARMQQMQALPQGPSVTVNGEVRNHIVPWTEGLTLVAALVAADYYGAADPGLIYLVRSGRATHVDTKKLLSGVDIPLQAGDVVQLLSQSPAPKP